MRRYDLPGVVIFVVLALAVVWLAMAPAPRPSAERSLRTFVVEAGSPLAVVLPPGTARIKVISMAELNTGAREGLDRARPYAFRVVWWDVSGRRVGSTEVALAAAPALGAPWDAVRSWDAGVLLPRATQLDVPASTPSVVSVSLEVDAGQPVLRARLYGERTVSLETPELALVRSDERSVEAAVRQLGLARWSDVTIGEALAVEADGWEALVPLRGSQGEARTVTTRLPDPPLSPGARRTLGEPLAAGEGRAWSLVGPAVVWVVGDGDLDSLAIHTVVAEKGRVPILPLAVPAPAWWTDGRARRIALPAGAQSLHLLGGTTPLDRVLVVVEDPLAVGTDAEAVPVESFAAEGGDDRWAVAPPRLTLKRARVGQQPAVWTLPVGVAGDQVALELRPLGRSARVTVRFRGGEREVDAVIEVPMLADPYDRAGPADAPAPLPIAVGEPVVRYLAPPAWAEQLTVRAMPGEDALVSVDLHGPETGSRERSDDGGVTTVRYARGARTAWHALAADDEEVWDLWVMTRREPLGTEERIAPAGWRSLEHDPVGGVRPGAPWLLPVGPEDAATIGPVWCRAVPNQDLAIAWSADAAREVDGVLFGALWAPSGQPDGSAWAIDLDGRPVARGRASTAVERWSRAATPGRLLRLTAAPGTVAWVRVPAVDRVPCARPWRARDTVASEVGSVARYHVDGPSADRWLVVGAVGSGPIDVEVTLGGPSVAGMVTDQWTPRRRVLRLEPREDGASAWALDRPTHHLTALAGAGLRLGADVGANAAVQVRQVSGAPARIYVLAERKFGDPEPIRGPVRVRSEQ